MTPNLYNAISLILLKIFRKVSQICTVTSFYLKIFFNSKSILMANKYTV